MAPTTPATGIGSRVALPILLLLLAGAPAAAASFTFRVDDASLVGNAPGAVSDDFGDGVLAPWAAAAGTVSESGGFLVLESPGTVEPASNLAGTWTQELSTAFRVGTWAVADGLGDFSFLSTWEQAVPALDQSIGIDFTTQLSDGTWEQTFLALANPSAAVAAAFGVSPGLGIALASYRRQDGGSGCCGPILSGSIQFSPLSSPVTGDVLFELDFDDASNLFDGLVSVDGGATYLAPFTPVSSLMDGYGAVSLTARQFSAVPEPPTGALLVVGSGLVGLARRRRGARAAR